MRNMLTAHLIQVPWLNGQASADQGMKHPLEIDAEEVGRLDSSQFQLLLNRILAIETFQISIRSSALVTSDEINVPDGGIDASIDSPDFAGSQFLPAGSSVWQAKAGKSKWPCYQAEVQKRDVKQAILDGHTYMLVLNRELNALQRTNQGKKLRAAIDEIKPGAPFELRSASQMASWVTRYPALWHHLDRPPHGWWNASEFLDQQPAHAPSYVWSSETESLRDAIRARLFHPGPKVPLRVHGRAGVGKTRFVLEALAGSSQVAVYAPYVSHEAEVALRWMCQRPDMTATLIVDECDITEAERLAIYVNGARGKINLVTIGTDALPELEGRFEIGPMDDQVLRAVVREVYPQIPLEQLLWIVETTRGFVKLARGIAEVARRSPLNLKIRDVSGLLSALLSEENQVALTAAALCTYVGWDGEVESEGRALSQHMGIEWRRCRRIIERLESSGYVGRAGRYRYVTPEILAIWLAAEEWATNRSSLEAMLTDASPDMAERMSTRLRQMPQVDEVVDLASEVLRSDGPFRDLAALNHPRKARFFSDFSRITPNAGVAALERILDGLDAEALRSLQEGRREIVWTLERLVANQHLFHAVARLMLRLAVAENEHFANNATGVFQSLFSPMGRKTAATGEERLELLSELIDTGNEDALSVAIGSFDKVFDVYGGYAVSADPGGQPPPSPWSPATRQEHVDYCRRALALLETLLDHSSQSVQDAAESVVLAQFRNFFWLGLADEALELVGRTDLTENLRRRLAIQLDNVITYDRDKPFMSTEMIARLRSVRQSFFADPLRERLHLRLGSWNRDLYYAARANSENAIDLETAELKELVADLLTQPDVLREEFDWITSEEAVKGRPFLSFLAEQDLQQKWLAPTLQAALSKNRSDIISSYVLGLSLAPVNHDVEALLDQWAGRLDLRQIVPQVTALLGLTELRALRLLQILENGLDPGALFCLEMARCEADLTLNTLSELLRAMAAADPPLTGTVWSILNRLLSNYTDENATSDPSLQDLLWELVGNPRLIGGSRDAYGSYSWAECAKPLIVDDPQRLASAIFEAVKPGREHLYAGSTARDVLEACFAAEPSGVWEAFAEEVEGESSRAWLVTSWAAEQRIAEVVGADVLKHWVDQDGAEPQSRIKLIAKLTYVDAELTPVIRWLVEEHEDSPDVIANLNLDYGMRFSWGGLADMEQPRLVAARQWRQDTHPAVRRWAQHRVEGLEQRVKQYREIDAESELEM